MTSPLFDSHAHVVSDDWETYPPAAKDVGGAVPEKTEYAVTLDALIGWMDEHGVDGACIVQRGRIYGFDNSLVVDSARRFPGRLTGVVMLNPHDPATPATYRELVAGGAVGGFRLQGPAIRILDPGWLCSEQSLETWAVCADLGTPVAVGLITQHLPFTLPIVEAIARRFPDLPILLDHGGTPWGTSQHEFGLARRAGSPIPLPPAPDFGIRESNGMLRDVPNVLFKITEINFERLVEAGVRPAHFVRRLVDEFGPDRVVWGSDIGQSMLWTYEQKAEMARAAADFLTEDESRKFLHDNAARVYSLNQN